MKQPTYQVLALISPSHSIEKYRGRVTLEQSGSRQGACMDFAEYHVLFDRNPVGTLYLIDAITFQDVYYEGEDPLKPGKKLTKNAHRIKPRDEADFSRLDNVRK